MAKKNKRHKCGDCGRVRLEKYMSQDMAVQHGVSVRELYPELNKNARVRWVCGDCEENDKRGK